MVILTMCKHIATGKELLVYRHTNNVDSQAGAARDAAHPAAGSIPALSRNSRGQRRKERLFRRRTWRTERRCVMGLDKSEAAETGRPEC
jgi:hypothetical protein